MVWNMKRKLAALLLTVCMAVTACGQTEETETKTENRQVEKADGDTETKVEISYETESEAVTAADGNEISYYDYSYPVVIVKGNEEASNEIANEQKKRRESFMEDLVLIQEDAEFAYGELEDAESKESFQSYGAFGSYAEKRVDENVISLSYMEWCYQGGAHDNSYMIGINYDVKTGKLLTFEDIFKDKKKGVAQVKENILEQCKVPYYSEKLFDGYEEEIDSVITDEYWYLTKEGMHIISNEYMLSSYATGCFEFIIPYDELTELKEEYQQISTYIYPVINGNSVEADLDSDGQTEQICYNVISTEIVENEGTEEEFLYESLESSLKINEDDFGAQFIELTGYIPENISDHYYLVDLDKNDKYIEIAVSDYGVNDYCVTYFIRYDKGELKYLGYVSDMIENQSCVLLGDGTLNAEIHSELMETARFGAGYYLDGETLTQKEQDWYYYDRTNWPEEYMKHNVLKEVTVYTSNDISSEKKVLTPADGPVTFPATDNKNWVQVKTASGETYYLYMEGMTEINSDGVMEDAVEVFENLMLAG